MNGEAPLGGKRFVWFGVLLASVIAACTETDPSPQSASQKDIPAPEEIIRICGAYSTAALLLSAPHLFDEPAKLAGIDPAVMGAQFSESKRNELHQRWIDEIASTDTAEVQNQRQTVQSVCKAGHLIQTLGTGQSLEETLIYLLLQLDGIIAQPPLYQLFNRPGEQTPEAFVHSLSSAELHHLKLLMVEHLGSHPNVVDSLNSQAY